MLDNRYIRIVQQPPAIVVRGAPFTFVAYCPKSNYNNNNSQPYGYQDVLLPANALGDRLTYRNGFATAHVIHADSRGPSLWLERESDGILVGGNTRAEFNATNENDRTMKFEFAINRTGIFTAVVRLHKRHIRRLSHGRVRRGDYIITSVATRRIQVCFCCVHVLLLFPPPPRIFTHCYSFRLSKSWIGKRMMPGSVVRGMMAG